MKSVAFRTYPELFRLTSWSSRCTTRYSTHATVTSSVGGYQSNSDGYNPASRNRICVSDIGVISFTLCCSICFLKNNMINSHDFILALRTTFHFNIFACMEHKLLSTPQQLLEFGMLFFFSQGYSFEEIVNKNTFVCDIQSSTKVTMSKILRLFSGSNDILWYWHFGTLIHIHSLNAHLNCHVIRYVFHL